MSNIYFMCENCGIETNGITFVNGMKFCAKCYHQIFGKDNQQTEITQLKQQLAEKQKTIDEINKEFVQAIHDWKTLCAEKDKELLEFKRDRLYFELLLTRLQWLHKKADDYRLEKERFGVADMSLCSVWDVLELQKNDLCEYEEMCALQEGIECIANSKLLADIEHDLEIKVTRNENEIFKDIELIDNQIKELKGE